MSERQNNKYYDAQSSYSGAAEYTNPNEGKACGHETSPSTEICLNTANDLQGIENFSGAKLMSHFVSSVYKKYGETTQVTSSYQDVSHYQGCSVFDAQVAPSISIELYMNRIEHHIPSGLPVFVVAIVLLCRHEMLTGIPITRFTAHRLVLTAFMLACKYCLDYHRNNVYFANVGGVYSGEMGTLENHFLKGIEYELFVGRDEYLSCVENLSKSILKDNPDQ